MQRTKLALTAAAILVACAERSMSEENQSDSASAEAPFPGRKSNFHGFDQYNFELEGRGCKVVVPKTVADGKPWVWRAQFWGHEPQLDIALLKRGYHVAHAVCGNALGSPGAMEHWDDLFEYLRFEHLFADRAVLEGMSRGGLYVFNWAVRHPEKVACIYADNPVCDFKSWPGGKGAGSGSPNDWQQCLNLYGLTEKEALAYKGNPIDNLKPLAEAGIPLIHVVGDADAVVPVAENTEIVEKRYRALGGTIKVIHKPTGHHPHCLKDPKPLVDFILKHNRGKGELTAEEIVGDKNFTLRGDMRNSRIQFEQHMRGHVAFIGGSITEMAGYRPKVCAMLKERFPETKFTFTDAGISSTCSDTGAFRLERDVLSKGPLDLFFVEFAVNDDQDGVVSYDDALRGMEGVIAQARAHNPYVDIVMTFFVNENILSKLRVGQTTDSIAAHSKVAEHYGVSVNNLAQELADLVNVDKMDWKKFGGTHPNDYGNTMCATMIRNALLETWSKPLPADAAPKAHPVVALIDEKSYSKGRFLPFSDVKVDESWQKGVPDWSKESKGMVRPRFRQSPMIYSSTAHSKLTVDFTGTAIGAYMLAGPDTGIIKCIVDGEQTNEIDTLHHHSGFNYPMTVMFFNELDGGAHTLELEILDNRPGRMKRGGTAFRALTFVGN
jgi:lysophospholipase L1-like esterase